LEQAGLLQAFRVTEDSVDAQLPDWRWLSVGPSGLTANILAERDDPGEVWTLIEAAMEVVGPRQYSHARVSYQHVRELPFAFDEAVALGHSRLFAALSTEEVSLDDWALLSYFNIVGPPEARGAVEFGIVQRHELPQRLDRSTGRSTGMLHLGSREWQPQEFKDVSLFADSDLTCTAQPGRESAFLEDAGRFWATSRAQMTRLIEGLGTKLIETGGSNG
jgi:hypothetical protein